MDTDYLSTETYNGILLEAEKLTHDLTLHYGLLSYQVENETEYIELAEKLTKKILKMNDISLEDFFWGDPPDKELLIVTLNKILTNIEEVRAIPPDRRKYDF